MSEDIVSITVEFEQPFYQCLEREAAHNGCSVGELLRRWVWIQHGDAIVRRYGSVSPAVAVEIPTELYERAGLLASASGSSDGYEQRRSEWLFNHIELDIEWVPADG